MMNTTGDIPPHKQGPEYYREKTRQVEEEMPHIQREVEFVDSLIDALKGGAGKAVRSTPPYQVGRAARAAKDKIGEYGDELVDVPGLEGHKAPRRGVWKDVGTGAVRAGMDTAKGIATAPQQLAERLLEILK